MPRLITYGCSFTSWKWSTWADILAEQLDLELINRGRVAGANNFALHRLKHDIKNGLFENDDVIRAFCEEPGVEVTPLPLTEGVRCEYGWQTLPQVDDGDGLYFSLLKKQHA